MKHGLTIGVILAAGDGTRMNSGTKNKAALKFNQKPMVVYAVDVLRKQVDHIVVVIGAHAQSIKKALFGKNSTFAVQKKRQGTGHAVKCAIKKITEKQIEAKSIIIGYGDHMMFYKPKTVRKLLHTHHKQHAQVTLLTTQHSQPNDLAWGRIIRDSQEYVTQIVEQKDATKEQKKVTELNPGFYCFDFKFLKNNLKHLKPSPVTQEYYLTDMVEIARQKDLKVCAYMVPFKEVGIGVNTRSQLKVSQQLHQKYAKSS